MSIIRKIREALKLNPNTVSVVSAKGELEVLDSSGKLNYHNGTTASPALTEAHSATVTNKSIDSDNNTITNIKNADIKAGAAIDRTKLASGTASHVVINDGTGAFSSEATLAKSRGGTGADNTNVTFPSTGTVLTADNTAALTNKTFDADGTGNSITNIENADIKAAAAIALNKLAATTASRAVVSDASGFLGASSVTSTELGYVSGVTSAIQTQLDNLTSSNKIYNLSLAASVSGNALTISLKDASGSDPSASSPVKIGFRNSTLATGTYNQRSITSALSLTISSGSTLGHVSATLEPIYVYAIDSGSGVVLAVATQTPYVDGELMTTTAEGGAGAADSRTTMYSTAAQTSKPGRLIGVIYSSQTTAGTWASAVTSIQLQPVPSPLRYILSSSCGSASTTSSSYSDATNLSVSFRTTGRPVWVGLIPDGSTNSYIGASGSNVATPNGWANILRDSTTIAENEYECRAATAGTDDPVSLAGVGSHFVVDFAPPGTYTYKVQYKASAGSLSINNVKLLVYEMGG